MERGSPPPHTHTFVLWCTAVSPHHDRVMQQVNHLTHSNGKCSCALNIYLSSNEGVWNTTWWHIVRSVFVQIENMSDRVGGIHISYFLRIALHFTCHKLVNCIIWNITVHEERTRRPLVHHIVCRLTNLQTSHSAHISFHPVHYNRAARVFNYPCFCLLFDQSLDGSPFVSSQHRSRARLNQWDL